jgi:hypothetical protein
MKRITADPWLAMEDGIVVFRGPLRPPVGEKAPAATKTEKRRLPRLWVVVQDAKNAAMLRGEILGI